MLPIARTTRLRRAALLATLLACLTACGPTKTAAPVERGERSEPSSCSYC